MELGQLHLLMKGVLYQATPNLDGRSHGSLRYHDLALFPPSDF